MFESRVDEGFLEGFACPKCGEREGFSIYASSWFRLYAEGVGDKEDVEWSDGSPVRCLACGNEASVGEFREANGVPVR